MVYKIIYKSDNMFIILSIYLLIQSFQNFNFDKSLVKIGRLIF